MGLDDLARKAREAWQQEKVQSAFRSEKAEGVSDSVLDRVADAADRATGGRYADQVEGARQAVDERIGTPAASTPDPDPGRSPEPGRVPEPGTVPGAPGDPTEPPTAPPTEPPTAPPTEPPERGPVGA